VDLYSTRIEWNQRSYVIMVLSKDKDVLEKVYIDKNKKKISQPFCKNKKKQFLLSCI